MSPPVYVPILKGKRGERRALQHLGSRTRAALTPLLELPEPAAGVSPGDHGRAFGSHLEKAWGDAPCFVDAQRVGLAYGSDDFMGALIEGLAESEVAVIPVVRVGDSPATRKAVAAHVRTTGGRLCVRSDTEEVQSSGFRPSLRQLIADCGAKPRDTDAVLDQGAVHARSAAEVAALHASSLQRFPLRVRFRSVVLGAGAFPRVLSRGAPTHGRNVLPRIDWAAWLRARDRYTGRAPLGYADYTVINPAWPDPNETQYAGSAAIRYAFGDDWIVRRGYKVTSARHGAYRQYNKLARSLVSDDSYAGPRFSWGDRSIREYAGETDKTGTPEIWISIGANHHMTLVTRQLANRRAS